MKKGIILLMLAMMLVGCANDPVETNQVSGVEAEEAGTSETVEEIEKMEVPELMDSDKALLNSTIYDWTFGAYDDCEFKYEYRIQNEGALQLAVFLTAQQEHIASIYNCELDDVESRIATDVTFESVYTSLLELGDDGLSQDISSMLLIYDDLEGIIYASKVWPDIK